MAMTGRKELGVVVRKGGTEKIRRNSVPSIRIVDVKNTMSVSVHEMSSSKKRHTRNKNPPLMEETAE